MKRVLFFTMKYTGLRSFADEARAYCDARGDIEAEHVVYDPPLWVKLVGAPVRPISPWDLAVSRLVCAWRAHVGGWFKPGGRYDLSRFDGAVFTSQYLGWAAAAQRRRGVRCRLGVYLDATVRSAHREWGDPLTAYAPIDAIERSIYRACDVVAASSRWAADSVRDDYGVPAEKIVYVPPTSTVPETLAARDDAGGKVRIAFIGNGWRRKGGPELLRWHQSRWKDRAELHLFSSEAPRHVPTGTPGVVVHGRVPREELITRVLPTMDLLVLPTRRDMSPWAVVEGQAAGLPCVVTRMAGTPSLVDDGRTGVLVAAGDEAGFVSAVEGLMTDRARLVAMRQASHAWARGEFAREVVFGRLMGALVDG